MKKNQAFKIKGESEYFLKKYGTSNPTIYIEDTDINIWGGSWMDQNGNPTAMLFGMRSGFEGLPMNGVVYYGHINSPGGLAELCHESEIDNQPNSLELEEE